MSSCRDAEHKPSSKASTVRNGIRNLASDGRHPMIACCACPLNAPALRAAVSAQSTTTCSTTSCPTPPRTGNVESCIHCDSAEGMTFATAAAANSAATSISCDESSGRKNERPIDLGPSIVFLSLFLSPNLGQSRKGAKLEFAAQPVTKFMRAARGQRQSQLALCIQTACGRRGFRAG